MERHRWQVMIFNVLTLTLILAALLAHSMWLVFPRARRVYCTWVEGQGDLVMWFDIKMRFSIQETNPCLWWLLVDLDFTLQLSQVPSWSVCCLRDLLLQAGEHFDMSQGRVSEITSVSGLSGISLAPPHLVAMARPRHRSTRSRSHAGGPHSGLVARRVVFPLIFAINFQSITWLGWFVLYHPCVFFDKNPITWSVLKWWDYYICLRSLVQVVAVASDFESTIPSSCGWNSRVFPWKIQRFLWIKSRGFVFHHYRPPRFGRVCFERILTHINQLEALLLGRALVYCVLFVG